MRLKKPSLLLILFLLTSLRSIDCFSQIGFFTDIGTRISVTYSDFTGEKLKGFASSTAANGFLLESKVGNNAISLVGGMGFNLLSGQEKISDAGTERDLAITANVMHLNFGMHFYLIPHRKFSFRPFLGMVGIQQYYSIKLPADVTYTSFAPSETVSVSGSALSAGIEYIPNRIPGKTSGFLFEVRSNNLGGKLFGESAFKIQGLTFILGMQY